MRLSRICQGGLACFCKTCQGWLAGFLWLAFCFQARNEVCCPNGARVIDINFHELSEIITTFASCGVRSTVFEFVGRSVVLHS